MVSSPRKSGFRARSARLPITDLPPGGRARKSSPEAAPSPVHFSELRGGGGGVQEAETHAAAAAHSAKQLKRTYRQRRLSRAHRSADWPQRPVGAERATRRRRKRAPRSAAHPHRRPRAMESRRETGGYRPLPPALPPGSRHRRRARLAPRGSPDVGGRGRGAGWVGPRGAALADPVGPGRRPESGRAILSIYAKSAVRRISHCSIEAFLLTNMRRYRENR